VGTGRMESLPLELLFMVVQCVEGVRELCALRAVSRLWKELVTRGLESWLLEQAVGTPLVSFSTREVGFVMGHVQGG
jgi:hypothetical protein